MPRTRPIVSSCLAVAGLFSLAVAQSPTAAPARAKEPFLRLRIDGKEQLAANPQLRGTWRALTAALREVAGDEMDHALAAVTANWSTIELPLELYAVAESSERFTVGLLAAKGTQSLQAHLAELALPAAQPVEIDGAQWSQQALGGPVYLLEGETAERHLVLLHQQPGDAGGAVRAFLAGVAQTSPGTQRLQRNLRGSGCELVLNVEVLLPLLPAAARQGLGILKTMVGPKFAGIAARIEPGAEHLTVDTWVDIAPGKGMLGNLLPAEGSGSSLLGWVPETSREFVNVCLAIDGITELLRFAGGFGAPLDPAQWGEEFAALEGTDVISLLDEHLTGEVQMLMVPTEAKDALDPDAEVPIAVLLGSPDGKKALARVRALFGQLMGGDADGLFVAAPAIGPGVATLTIDGEQQVHVFAHDAFFAVAGADDASTDILRQMVATGGKSKLPQQFSTRATGDFASARLVGAMLQHQLSNIQGQVMMRDLSGRGATLRGMRSGLQAAVDAIAAEFAGDRGLAAVRIFVEDQVLRIQQVW